MMDDDDDLDVDVDLDDQDELEIRTEDDRASVDVLPEDLDVDVDDDEGIGMQLQIGGGTGQFIGQVPRAATSYGGNWDVRAIFGSNSVLGLEAAYIGSAQSISGLGLEDTNLLLGNGIEGNVRLGPTFGSGNVDVKPFAFGGLGYEYYTILGSDATTASVNDQDNVVTLPAGVGVELGIGPATFDARALYRHAFDSDMFGESNGFDERALSKWGVSVGVGFEF